MTRMSAAKAGIMKRHMALLEERYDLSNNPAPGVTMSRNKPVQQGVRVKLAAGVTWDQLAKLHSRPGQSARHLSRRLSAAAAPQSSGRRHGLSEVRNRRDQKTGGPRSDALRSGLRYSRSLPAGISSADLSDHPARPGRRLQGQTGHHRELTTNCSTAFSIPSKSKVCGCWSRRFRNSSSTRPTIAAP